MLPRLSWYLWIACLHVATCANSMPATAGTALTSPNATPRHARGTGKTGAARAPTGIRTGFSGHFACKAFAGLDRKLCMFASDEQARQARWAVQDGANVNARAQGLVPRGMTMLHVAIWHKWSLRSITILLDCGADVNARDAARDTPLIYATRDPDKPNAAQVRLLIQHGADVNARGGHGMTPLMYAALYRQGTHAVSMLLDAGADVHAADDAGWTALMHATRNRHDAGRTVKLLLAAGAHVDRKHDRGGTALMSACFSGNPRCARQLLDAGADVNASDQAGWTPLLCAVMSNKVELVDALLRAGADPKHADRLGRTPRTLAARAGNSAIANRLRHARR